MVPPPGQRRGAKAQVVKAEEQEMQSSQSGGDSELQLPAAVGASSADQTGTDTTAVPLVDRLAGVLCIDIQ